MTKYFFAIGVLILCLFIFFTWKKIKFINHSELIEGVVVRNEEHRRVYTPIIEYRYNNEVLEYRSIVSSNPPDYAIGDKVTLLIDKTNNQSIRENSFFTLWVECIVTGLLGLVFTTIGILGWNKKSKKSRTKGNGRLNLKKK